MTKTNQKGKFAIAHTWFGKEEVDPQILDLFSKSIFPIDVTYDALRYRFLVVAICHQFDEVEEGELIPWYEVTYHPQTGWLFERKDDLFWAEQFKSEKMLTKKS